MRFRHRAGHKSWTSGRGRFVRSVVWAAAAARGETILTKSGREFYGYYVFYKFCGRLKRVQFSSTDIIYFVSS